MVRLIAICTLFVCMSVVFNGCKNEIEPNETYTKILFKRDGGGSKEFYVTTNSGHEIIMDVTKYKFRDTTYTTLVFVKDEGKLSNLITRVIDHRVVLKGDFKQSELETGTWAYIYVVDEDNNKTEITNTSLRDSLMILETLVENGRK
ncbi:MAG: hypothetical protein WCR42_11875 [bacterium]